jgi:allantoinase
MKTTLYSQNVLLPHTLGAYSIHIADGKIIDIEAGRHERADFEFRDMGNLQIMPGVIDAHVHINEPGRTEWEGFDTGTRASVAGGVTTLVDMPLNASPVTVTVADLQTKIASTAGKLHANVGFWGGIVPNNTEHLRPLADAGVLGFKAFLTHSGIDEFPNADEATLHAAYQALKGTNLPILAHCELTTGDYSAALSAQPSNYLAYLASRPRVWENEAVKLMIRLAEQYQHPTHIVHLASAEALADIRAAKSRGVPITVETCPHYIFFNAEDIPNADTRYKCAPPIRERANNELLWAALVDGTLDFVGSDHSPAPPDIKSLQTGNFQTAWGGISGIQFTLSAIHTGGAAHGLSPHRLAQILCSNPARFIGQAHKKGQIAVGFDADFVVWNPEADFVVSPDMIQARHKISPYDGLTLRGQVEQTYISGQKVWDKNTLTTPNIGTMLFSI